MYVYKRTTALKRSSSFFDIECNDYNYEVLHLYRAIDVRPLLFVFL